MNQNTRRFSNLEKSFVAPRLREKDKGRLLFECHVTNLGLRVGLKNNGKNWKGKHSGNVSLKLCRAEIHPLRIKRLTHVFNSNFYNGSSSEIKDIAQ
jgi:hypothetical protein